VGFIGFIVAVGVVLTVGRPETKKDEAPLTEICLWQGGGLRCLLLFYESLRPGTWCRQDQIARITEVVPMEN
jgi:hypothetical protein